jgi:hypothetical protein
LTFFFFSLQSQLWIDIHGALHTFDGSCSVQSSSSANRIQRGKWQILTMIVDCVEREMEVYLDGVCIHTKGSGEASKGLTPPGMEIDNLYSIGGELSLFGDLQPPQATQGLTLSMSLDLSLLASLSSL